MGPGAATAARCKLADRLLIILYCAAIYFLEYYIYDMEEYIYIEEYIYYVGGSIILLLGAYYLLCQLLDIRILFSQLPAPGTLHHLHPHNAHKYVSNVQLLMLETHGGGKIRCA